MSASNDINAWLIDEGRRLGEAKAIVDGYSARLVRAGVPLSRANIAQRFANPLLVAWGIVRTPKETTKYEVARSTLDTTSYIGGPFEYVMTKRKPLHKSLTGLNRETEHSAYVELADGGGTDLYAHLLHYGDGSAHGGTFVSNDPDGFQERHLELIHETRHGLASAMEPVAMRSSTASLLQTYLGNGPALAVREGTIQRGEHAALEAVVMFGDLRGFTKKTETWSEAALLAALNGYFDVVVQAVEANGGDVLKFMGDGILSIFPIDEANSRENCCRNAANAPQTAIASLNVLNVERQDGGEETLAMGMGINLGPVTYGNIGSPDRLDFTVLGSAVNVASRVQDLCKTVGEPVLATEQVALCIPDSFSLQGSHSVRGVAEPIEVFALGK
ncbi:MAG: adenylate/guanylate cyclase domain-containing protein [Hyphomicrobiales bacterium]|nr:adenylate/guanylate cyclase domain-containing protein [Hyphomicrobiales bacterium]